jgi:hypothetical protein
MAEPDLLYLSTSALIIETNMGSVRATLAEGSCCYLPGSKRGARKVALLIAQTARDRLDSLIADLGEKP